MKEIVIYGAGGFAREIAFFIEQINEKQPTWYIKGFVDDNSDNVGTYINGYPVIGTGQWLASLDEEISVVIGIGSSRVREAVVQRLARCLHIQYPNIIHPSVILSNTTKMGVGNVIGAGSVLTCNIKIGSFVTIHSHCTIGHDATIDDFATILPRAAIAGNVHLGRCVDFGTNATIIQGLSVGEYSVIGAGAVVVRNIPAYCTAVGVPAKPIKFQT
ncbi:sugar O-acyltransferase (sialic acid O-acetyltransferase NeuD family) [Anoxybacillus voinovskiensis]|uniref:Sugar O-acyltransferase (Sialic acid O-acetyltransferase NeuD family) n=1 Tax=Anoxybacteroides voinovskiense TaxID=230470 RepID=A0A840DWB7_9BACL|nr:acetyltransferase [Anoxybacillus voinovskiensis]MBB4073809.1 sugar O-acyltransferase (sialic acid O-acetyltransferase NeuD family) [Anoxybacillus voinovskiensis]GGJ63747.1 transferase [Anoxybacillus voinovskiensis]